MCICTFSKVECKIFFSYKSLYLTKKLNVKYFSQYICTGTPHPADVDAIMTQLLNEPFSKAYRNISCIRREKGLAMQDVIKCVFERSNDLVFPPPVKMYIASKLADLENHLAHATSEDIQLGGLVGCFIVAREMIAAEKNKN